MKDDLSQKIHGNMVFSSNVLERWSLQKNRSGIRSFLYYQERWHFFSRKYDIFSTAENEKCSFSKNTLKFQN